MIKDVSIFSVFFYNNKINGSNLKVVTHSISISASCNNNNNIWLHDEILIAFIAVER